MYILFYIPYLLKFHHTSPNVIPHYFVVMILLWFSDGHLILHQVIHYLAGIYSLYFQYVFNKGKIYIFLLLFIIIILDQYFSHVL